MSVILFGAGASYGSGEVEPDVPPLTPGLMNALSAEAPQSWGRLPDTFQSLFIDDFERGMTELGRVRPDLLPPLQRSMAQFFFGFVPGRENLYRELGRRIAAAGWGGTLVTLNYERLLQLSLEAEGVQPSYRFPDREVSEVELCVPHGSCHLFVDDISAVAGDVEFAGTEVATGGDPIVVDDSNEFVRRIEDDAFPPVMSYFDPAKDTTSGVNFILQQRARFNELSANADRIVVVGVAVRPHDAHLWKPLAESPAELLFCSGAEAAADFMEWAEACRPDQSNRPYHTYFSDSFDELCGVVGL